MTLQRVLPLADAPPAPEPARAGRIKRIHADKVAARRELMRYGFWPLGVGPTDPETWADKKLKRRFCFRTEGATVRLVEVTTERPA